MEPRDASYLAYAVGSGNWRGGSNVRLKPYEPATGGTILPVTTMEDGLPHVAPSQSAMPSVDAAVLLEVARPLATVLAKRVTVNPEAPASGSTNANAGTEAASTSPSACTHTLIFASGVYGIV